MSAELQPDLVIRYLLFRSLSEHVYMSIASPPSIARDPFALRFKCCRIHPFDRPFPWTYQAEPNAILDRGVWAYPAVSWRARG